MAEILLREQLGIDVEVYSFQRLDELNGNLTNVKAYERLSHGAMNEGVDADLELWPEEPVNAAARRTALTGDAVFANDVSFVSQHGWFVPIKAVPSTLANWSLQLPSGAEERVEAVLDPWYSFFPLYRFGTLIQSMICASPPWQDNKYNASRGDIVFGQYDCNLATWYPTDGSIKPCRVMLSGNPQYAPNRNEIAITSSGLPMQIFYVPDVTTIEELVEIAETMQTPFILHEWEPSRIIIPGRFLRIRQTPLVHCPDDYALKTSQIQTKSRVEKVVNNELAKIARDANELIFRFRLSFEDVQEVLRIHRDSLGQTSWSVNLDNVSATPDEAWASASPICALVLFQSLLILKAAVNNFGINFLKNYVVVAEDEVVASLCVIFYSLRGVDLEDALFSYLPIILPIVTLILFFCLNCFMVLRPWLKSADPDITGENGEALKEELIQQ
ncbi:MAG: hypothetical protein SGPRY_007358, partial [Prymnesium sp.]